MKKLLFKNIKGLVQFGEDINSLLGGDNMAQIPILENAFLAVEDGEIVAYGPMEDWGGVEDWRNLEVIDAEGKYVLPAFCDSHTHTVFAKTREEEIMEVQQEISLEINQSKEGQILKVLADNCSV